MEKELSLEGEKGSDFILFMGEGDTRKVLLLGVVMVAEEDCWGNWWVGWEGAVDVCCCGRGDGANGSLSKFWAKGSSHG